MTKLRTALLAATVASFATAAPAQEKLKVGVMATLSGPAAVLGQHMRDGFLLGIKDLGGKLGGLETEVIKHRGEAILVEPEALRARVARRADELARQLRELAGSRA